jgi:septal ring factor EnvC (AmiA/AmiB activator)
VPDLDPYVKAIQDLLGPLGSPADRMRAIEQAVARLRQPDETRPATEDFIDGLSKMPAHMRELQSLLSEFASPASQLRSFQEQLATTRQQLELMAKQLESVEGTIGRFAELAEQLAAMQEPFRAISGGWWPQAAQ